MANEIKVDLSSIGKNMVKKVPSMEEVALETLWQENTIVLTFFRRFGCLFCRQGAKELSRLTPILESHGVQNIGVGLEDFGLEEFVEGNFFSGELYVDIEKKTFKGMGYKRWRTLGALMSMFGKSSRDALAKNKTEQLAHNLQGDGLQAGGTLVITKGGAEVLMDFRQDNPADHVENAEILKVLGICSP